MAGRDNREMSRRRFLKATAAGALAFSSVPLARRIGGAPAEETKKPAHSAAELPVQGFHAEVLERGDVSLRERFIRDALPREGVNVLVLEIGYYYAFKSYPQVAESNAMAAEDLKRVVAACADAGVELVPLFNCLGHQSDFGRSSGLLRAFPEFDERPDIPQDASAEQINSRCYCPLHPRVHEVVFALLDELAEACGAKRLHVGMDEVFLIGEEKCPRCRGKDPAELFAGEVKVLHDHLASRGLKMWMWGDRFINAAEFGIDRWSGSKNGTWPAVDKAPKDIVICDWHYTKAIKTPAYFVGKGLGVVAAPYRAADVALEQLKMIRELRTESALAMGMLQTSWSGFDTFVRAYYGEPGPETGQRRRAIEAASCFKTLFAAIRGER
jgi:hypothetical protein